MPTKKNCLSVNEATHYQLIDILYIVDSACAVIEIETMSPPRQGAALLTMS
jgi:hypothetical protein